MKYYLIVGETSGELHASHLMRSLKYYDNKAQFRFIGGDLMQREGGVRVRHYKEMAYMGFIPVLMHLRTIFRNMDMVKRDIVKWQPDVVILVDYAGFNLNIAKYLKKNTNIPVYYYISPKIWAWKEHRIKAIKRDVDEMFSILPFEVDFFEKKHNYPIHYVGNPTADEVRLFCKNYNTQRKNFLRKRRLHPYKPIIALLAGSRKQEIKDNLPAMIEAASHFTEGYQIVLACAPSVEDEFYDEVLRNAKKKGIKTSVVRRVKNSTYPLLFHSTVALVTSGTATLETALFDVPQVVCYKVPMPRIARFAFNHIIKVKFISLVNLICNREVVKELFAERFTVETITSELKKILPGRDERDKMLSDYAELRQRLGDTIAPDNAALLMVKLLKERQASRATH